MTININQPNEPPTKLPLAIKGIKYLVPEDSAIAEIVNRLPDEESLRNFIVIHNASLRELEESLKNPVEIKKAELFCSLADIAGFPFEQFYLRELNLQYFYSVIPTQLTTEKQVYDSISHLAPEKEDFLLPIGPEVKVFINIDLFPTYGECLRFNSAFLRQLKEMAEDNHEIRRIIQEINKLQLGLSRSLRRKSNPSGDLCPSICHKCWKYEFFERGQGRDIPRFCKDCQREKKELQTERYNKSRRKTPDGWVAAFGGEARTCQAYEDRESYQSTCHGRRRQVNKDLICKKCFNEKKGTRLGNLLSVFI